MIDPFFKGMVILSMGIPSHRTKSGEIAIKIGPQSTNIVNRSSTKPFFGGILYIGDVYTYIYM